MVKKILLSALIMSSLFSGDVTSGLKQLSDTYENGNKQTLENWDKIFSDTSAQGLGTDDSLQIQKAAMGFNGNIELLQAVFSANEAFFIVEDALFKTYFANPDLVLLFAKMNLLNPLEESAAQNQCGIDDQELLNYCYAKAKIAQERQKIRSKLQSFLQSYQSNIGGLFSLVSSSVTLIGSLKNKNLVQNVQKIADSYHQSYLNYLSKLDVLEQSLETNKQQYLQKRQSAKILVR